MNIAAKRMRYIVPFKFGDDKKPCREVIASLDEMRDEYNGAWYQTSVRKGEQDIYEYIVDSFDESGYSLESNIGASFLYKPDKEGRELPKLTYHINHLDASNKKYVEDKQVDFEISEIGLFLFNTGIGLLWYEISDLDLAVDELAEFNFHFKELNFKKNFFLFTSTNYDNFILGDWICRILKPLNTELKFYSSRENVCMKADSALVVPDKAVLFNYVVFQHQNVNGENGVKSDGTDSVQEQLVKSAFYLSRGYKSSYKVLPNAKDEMYHPYDNAYWSIAREGAGYYLLASEDNYLYYTGDKGLREKVINDYFLIFVLILQQTYTLLMFAEAIGEGLTANPDKYLDSELYMEDEEEQRKNDEFLKLERKVRKLTTEVNVYLTKNVRASVSHVQQQNEFYQYAKTRLHVLEDTNDLTTGLESLQGLLHDSKQQWEAKEESARDNRINITLGLFSIVAFISAVYDCESLVKDFFMQNSEEMEGVLITRILPYGMVFLLLMAFWLFVIFYLLKNISPSVSSFQKKLSAGVNSLFHWHNEAKMKQLMAENAMILEESMKDSLTGCFNRKGATFYSKAMLREAKKKRKNLFVCSIDLNGLKYINDTFGHTEGDRAIKEVAGSLMQAVPDSAKVFRTGGDEFQIVGVFERKTTAPEQILAAFDSKILEINNNSNLDYKIGASYGFVMNVPEKTMTDIDDWFKEADAKMYDMKVRTDEHRRE